jgi:hypothetical protein
MADLVLYMEKYTFKICFSILNFRYNKDK